ncbi:hypothetical protein PTSG_01353 [Salpingoeca rosetta]|uniref:Opioid growth factor receptor (OGFr) conserved domain-containing protein n=1 Tax=Salpingoeca rosetta (strain ATCC 50818 / BSB-021) TaxID=946362 RepID=F2U036_SALR5|nr:uncharacterized protein PTSG_01353 [Salpingoeca rosetta]EGD80764.1 hypothetical protein PTSG_01353 [Salpingoeca rosetta]|eukprot:XP_004997325.1 hypothetical protein PTSG_01353 [Salpingoeca rosetta]
MATKTKTTMACLMRVLGPSGRLVARDASRTTSPLPKRVSTVVTATTTTTTATTATTTTTAPSTSGSSSPLATLASDLTATLPSSSSTSATASSSSPTTTTRSASTTTNAATTYPVPELNGAQHPSIVRLKQAIAKLKSMPAVFEAASSLSSWASADLARFRSPSYGAGQDSQTRTKNLDFYCNRIPSQPNGDLIDAIHSTWLHKHALLEEHHGYIQWLFPLHEAGVNGLAQVLQRPELEQMRRDPKIRIRVQRSFELMLDFYGFVLEDP